MKLFLLTAILLVLLIGGCTSQTKQERKIQLACSDGTNESKCSTNKPYLCLNVSLVLKASICGCEENFTINEERCLQIEKCVDGTKYSECSTNKPQYCYTGELINKSDLCGCPQNFENYNGSCINKSLLIAGFLFYYINELRTVHKIPALYWDEKLVLLAQSHSDDMAKNNYTSVVDKKGSDPTDRASRIKLHLRREIGNGYYTEEIRETVGRIELNITYYYTIVLYQPFVNPDYSSKFIIINNTMKAYISPEDTADSISKTQFTFWRYNMAQGLIVGSPAFTYVGIGVSYDSQSYYITADFW